MAGLDRWRARHPDAAQHLAVDDVLVDGMRGRSTLWWRVRVNLRHVPEELRPAQEPPDPDYDPWSGIRPEDVEAWRAEEARRRQERAGPGRKS